MLEIANTVLVCIDIQGNLARAMDHKEDLFRNAKILISGIRALEVPIVWTEQNPQRLGETLPEVADLLSGFSPIPKMMFSCCGEEAFMHALEQTGRRQVLIAGIEAHVCVYQTARDLAGRGYEVQVVADAVSSRTAGNKAIALEKLKTIGAGLTSTEMALFELMKTAEHPRFREISKIVK